MRKQKFTEEQIAFVLKQVEHGAPLGEVCRKVGISEMKIERWRKDYNEYRPHSGLTYRTPADFAQTARISAV